MIQCLECICTLHTYNTIYLDTIQHQSHAKNRALGTCSLYVEMLQKGRPGDEVTTLPSLRCGTAACAVFVTVEVQGTGVEWPGVATVGGVTS